MEDNQNSPREDFQNSSFAQDNKVSFPTVGERGGKGGGAKTFLIVGILVLIGILGYVIYRSASSGNEEITVEPSPFQNTIVPPEEGAATPSVSPSASPSAKIDKDEIKIQVQNGTGVSGEAAYLQNILEGLGYSDITVGNAAAQDETDTSCSFSNSLPLEVTEEIMSKLNATYQSVTKTSATSTNYDVVIITGLRKGVTPKPTRSPSPSATPKPTATP
jgi:hypothetical protein